MTTMLTTRGPASSKITIILVLFWMSAHATKQVQDFVESLTMLHSHVNRRCQGQWFNHIPSMRFTHSLHFGWSNTPRVYFDAKYVIILESHNSFAASGSIPRWGLCLPWVAWCLGRAPFITFDVYNIGISKEDSDKHTHRYVRKGSRTLPRIRRKCMQCRPCKAVFLATLSSHHPVTATCRRWLIS